MGDTFFFLILVVSFKFLRVRKNNDSSLFRKLLVEQNNGLLQNAQKCFKFSDFPLTLPSDVFPGTNSQNVFLNFTMYVNKVMMLIT